MRRTILLGPVALLMAACTGSVGMPVPAGALPVLFVHGYGASSAVFADVIDHLRDRGYRIDQLLAVDITPPDRSVVAAAEQIVAPAVERLAATTPVGQVIIVGHSAGALSSRWYARSHPERVRALVTVAGANHGTDALCGADGGAAADLCPAFTTSSNPVQNALNGTPGEPADETAYGRGADRPGVASLPPLPGREICYVALLVSDDDWIRPNSSAELDGADLVARLPAGRGVTQPRPGNVLFGDRADHDGILEDERFFAMLDIVLDEAAP